MTTLTWLSRRQRDGGIDPVPLPAGVPGTLWLCGKHAIAPHVQVVVDATSGWVTVVCLTERHELAERYPEYVGWLDVHAPGRQRAVWFPIPDLHAPSVDAMLPFVDDLVERLQRGDHLLVHCGAGIGRAGTTAVCILLRLGADLDEALAQVAASRPMAGPEVGAQRDLVIAVASRLSASP